MRNGRAAVVRLPPHAAGMRIGLYGGSFNPPHAGHLHVARTALRRLRLDRLWWMVSPGNPLKSRAGLPPLHERMAAVRALTGRDPRIHVTGLEADLGLHYTADVLDGLVRRAPGVRFVWIMGADGLFELQRWRRWPDIARTMPFAVVDRPGWTLSALNGRAARALAGWRKRETDAARLADMAPPAWVFLHGPRLALSSTMLRQVSSESCSIS